MKISGKMSAMPFLKSRKKFQNFSQHLGNHLCTLQEQLLNIDQMESTNNIYDIMNLVEKTGKEINRDVSEFETLMDKIED